MRCPNCHKDHKKKYGMTCNCGYQFEFHPANDGLTDGRFQAILRAASANDTWYFTFNGFYATYCRRQRPKAIATGAGMLAGAVLLGIGASLLVAPIMQGETPGGWWPFAAFLTLVGTFLFSGTLYSSVRPPASPEKVRTLLDRWRSHGHEVPMLLTKLGLHSPPPEWPESDIYDYGAERVIVVEHDLLVDWLVMNHFHATERAVIVSQHGYPEYILPRLEHMLAQRRDLPVFLLHDATLAGSSMTMGILEGRHRLSHLLAGHPVIDLGLSVEGVKKLRALRAIRPRSMKYEVPVDYVPYGMLSAGIAAAMVQGVPLHELPQRSDGDSSGGSFG